MICSICGRKLSNPKSIELGYGPVCYGKVSGSAKAGNKIKGRQARPPDQKQSLDIPGQISMEEYLQNLT